MSRDGRVINFICMYVRQVRAALLIILRRFKSAIALELCRFLVRNDRSWANTDVKVPGIRRLAADVTAAVLL